MLQHTIKKVFLLIIKILILGMYYFNRYSYNNG